MAATTHKGLFLATPPNFRADKNDRRAQHIQNKMGGGGALDLKALLVFGGKQSGVYDGGGGTEPRLLPKPSLLWKDMSAFILKDRTRPDFTAVSSFAAADQGMFPYGKHVKIRKGKMSAISPEPPRIGGCIFRYLG